MLNFPDDSVSNQPSAMHCYPFQNLEPSKAVLDMAHFMAHCSLKMSSSFFLSKRNSFHIEGKDVMQLLIKSAPLSLHFQCHGKWPRTFVGRLVKDDLSLWSLVVQSLWRRLLRKVRYTTNFAAHIAQNQMAVGPSCWRNWPSPETPLSRRRCGGEKDQRRRKTKICRVGITLHRQYYYIQTSLNLLFILIRTAKV